MFRPYTKIKKDKRAGFTLIEIVIVVTVATILVTMVVSGFKDYQRYQRYQLFFTDIKNSLNEAHIKTVGSVGGTTYGVYVGTSTVEFYTGVIPTVGSASNYIIKFPTGMHATSTLSNNKWYFNFNRITGVGSATGTISVVDDQRNETLNLLITGTGLIK